MSPDINIEKIIEWLGPYGAVEGLSHSTLTASDLHKIAAKLGLNVEKKSSRRDVICDIVNFNRKLLIESPSDLKDLSRRELEKLIHDRNVSAAELNEILESYGIRPKKLTRSKLIDFFVNEIADMGMYERVSKGTLKGVT